MHETLLVRALVQLQPGDELGALKGCFGELGEKKKKKEIDCLPPPVPVGECSGNRCDRSCAGQLSDHVFVEVGRSLEGWGDELSGSCVASSGRA